MSRGFSSLTPELQGSTFPASPPTFPHRGSLPPHVFQAQTLRSSTDGALVLPFPTLPLSSAPGPKAQTDPRLPSGLPRPLRPPVSPAALFQTPYPYSLWFTRNPTLLLLCNTRSRPSHFPSNLPHPAALSSQTPSIAFIAQLEYFFLGEWCLKAESS